MASSSAPLDDGSNAIVLLHFLAENPTVGFIRYCWLDFSGVLRARVLPKAQCLKLSSHNQPLRVPTSGCMGLIQIDDVPNTFRPGGSDCVCPDWSSLRLLSHEHASVLCDYSEGEAVHLDIQGLPEYGRCPRSALKRAVSDAQDQCGIDLTAGFELEFWLVRPETLQHCQAPDIPDHNYWSSATGLHGEYGVCVEKCVKNLQQAGVEVEQYHMESGWQQFEIATGPMPILSSVDTLIQSQDIIRQTAILHGLRATFLPRPFPGLSASGVHAHLSFQQTTGAAKVSQGPQDISTEEAFLAGILHRLPLLCVFGMPNEFSYSRIGGGMAGDWVTWGSGNRAVPIRKINDRHFELRTIDATANMYIALSAYVGAGILGIIQKEKLRWRDCYRLMEGLDEKGREELGIDTRLPLNIDESMTLSRDCEKTGYMDLSQVLGQELLDHYMSIKRLEHLNVSRMTEEERNMMYLKFI